MEHTIDAKGKSLGRVASAAAVVLLGKNSASYRKDRESENSVLIINSKDIKIAPKKIGLKTYAKYSGYPGGLKKEKMSKVIDSKGVEEALRLAVYGMLPTNRTRTSLMKKLKIS